MHACAAIVAVVPTCLYERVIKYCTRFREGTHSKFSAQSRSATTRSDDEEALAHTIRNKTCKSEMCVCVCDTDVDVM